VGIRFNWPVELHPMLVHFSIALLCFALLLDAGAWLWRSQPARILIPLIQPIRHVQATLRGPRARPWPIHHTAGVGHFLGSRNHRPRNRSDDRLDRTRFRSRCTCACARAPVPTL